MQLLGGADVGQVTHGCLIAREQQVVAVVDRAGELRVHVGTAPAARLATCFIKRDCVAVARQRYGGGKPRKTGAYDVCSGQGGSC